MALQTPKVLRTEPVLILFQCNHAGYILQREVRTIAKGHNHAVAHLLHCSAMPHVACALALTRSLLESSRRHSMPKVRGCMLSVMSHSLQSSLSRMPWCKHLQVLS